LVIGEQRFQSRRHDVIGGGLGRRSRALRKQRQRQFRVPHAGTNPLPGPPGRDLAHTIYRPLANAGASSERSNLLQIVPAEDARMNRIEYLQDQAARAERLANSSLDKLTLERLAAFAEECRAQVKMIAEGKPMAGHLAEI
jgi:hypothetical protein